MDGPSGKSRLLVRLYDLFMETASCADAALTDTPLSSERRMQPCFILVAERSLMIDVIYVIASVLFFVLMLAYAAACNRLGRTADVEHAGEDVR